MMAANHGMSDKYPGGWTLIVLLIVVAIIALLMMYYLPSVMQMYSPPKTADEEGTRKPTTEVVKDRLSGIDQRNKQIEDFLNQQDGTQEEQSGEGQEEDQEDYYEE